MPTDVIFLILVIGFSVILHEVAHGYVANWLGDPTARLEGRLTLNPIKHIDPFGSIVLPGLLALTGVFAPIGYAKPVPYNPHNIRNKNGEALVAAAGPATNLLLALIFGLSLRFFGEGMDANFAHAFALITIVNVSLALFNLIPIPPFDGSKAISAILPGQLRMGYESMRANLERMGFLANILVIMLLITLFSAPFSALVSAVFVLIAG